MTSKQQADTDEYNLRKELEQEEKASRKARSMELLRQLSSKLSTINKQKTELLAKEQTLLKLKEEVYSGYVKADTYALDAAATKINTLGF